MIQRQTDQTLNYMQANGSITYKQMMSVLNINSPRDIIRQLKKDGVPILTERVQYTKKDGTKSFYHIFSIKENIDNDKN